MAGRIEDYAIIGDTNTVALVDRSGSIDWWCVPRIDSAAAFAALLGTPEHGRWLLAPEGGAKITRRYEDDTLVLETLFHTATGDVAVIDFMAPGHPDPTIHRVVEGRSGRVRMHSELVVRFDYGSITPWVRATGDGLTMVAGPDGLRFHSPVRLEGLDHTTVAGFEVTEGERLAFSLSWFASQVGEAPLPLDSLAALHRTRRWWREWVAGCTYDGEWRDDVIRSLITLKALTYGPTGAVCAAATTSLPEDIGGVRNWDYRYSWLRDATLTLQSLLLAGYRDEASDWSRWLRRAVAGNPGDFQIMYGVGGERRLTELDLDWLPGYEGSAPVRIGNGASTQFQLDVFGEVMDAAYTAATNGLHGQIGYDGEVIVALMDQLVRVWDQPDEGIWEVRGPRRHFTHSKVMAWVAFDRAIRLAELTGAHGERIDRWHDLRQQVHDQVCAQGFSADLGSFTQYYGSSNLDASLLMIPLVGFLPPDDPRVLGTIDAVQRTLLDGGFVRRYETEASSSGDDVDGLPGSEGAFLVTTFWLADALAL
ncbi:MAG: glycoside hydrolase family 15 protein, partial [Acidobacteria bacterium]|nr:glycoside hydrolase family 15 protein [Acidobacteriota bacterium]